MDRRQLLGSVSIFSGLSDKELDQLLQATTTKRLKAKEILFRKGDPGNQLYGILKGALKVMTTATDGKDVMFGLMGPGEVLGEIALLDSEDRSATIVAVEATELLTLHRRELIPFLEKNPRAAIALAGVLAARVRTLSERAEDRQTMPLPGRIAKKLLALSEEHGKRPIVGGPVEVRLPQQDLADLVGVTRESVNKQLRAWEEEGIVALGRGRVVLKNPEALEAVTSLYEL
ncbi:MAG: Crp/Fnr family transcriptional regulator [Spirochaetaceae bacterium]|nr:Crp/Fnr family transcriptional regulator [Myxococcales bacterium]MCB9723782.1 Crp/Fnr family transcriptional regulator [Spirochaetaceae bacterium]